MHEPFHVRPADHRYVLRTYPTYGWATGTAADGSLVLRCGKAWLLFDPDGTLVRVGDEPVAYRDGPIAVRRFWLPDRWIGVEDLPDSLAAYDTAPDEFEMRPEDVESWVRAGQFMFYPGASDYIMGRGGKVEAS